MTIFLTSFSPLSEATSSRLTDSFSCRLNIGGWIPQFPIREKPKNLSPLLERRSEFPNPRGEFLFKALQPLLVKSSRIDRLGEDVLSTQATADVNQIQPGLFRIGVSVFVITKEEVGFQVDQADRSEGGLARSLGCGYRKRLWSF